MRYITGNYPIMRRGFDLAAPDRGGGGLGTTTGLTDNQFAVGGQDGTSFAIYVNAVPAGTTALTARLNGATLVSLGGSTAATYRVTGLSENTPFRVEVLASTPTDGGAGATKAICMMYSDARGFRGWDVDLDLGTTGDWFVDPLNGDDTNGGASAGDAFETLGAAISASGAADVIKVRGGDVRLPSTQEDLDNITIEGYSDEKPRIVVAAALTTWTQCSSPTDDAVLGATLAASGNVWKKTGVTQPANISDVRGINLFEAGKRLYHAQNRADISDLFARFDQNNFHTADSYTFTGNAITNVVDASVINSSNYTDAQLQAGAAVILYGNPNASYLSEISTSDVATNTITTDASVTVQGGTAPGDSANYLYSIINCARDITQGTWAVIDQGATMDIYVYPNDADNLDFIEYSLDTRVLQTLQTGTCTNVILRGLHLAQPGGSADNDGVCVYGYASANNSTGFQLKHCMLSGGDAFGSTARAIRLQSFTGAEIENNSVFDFISGRGCFLSSIGARQGTTNLVRRNHFQQIGGAGFYAYDQAAYAAIQNLAENCGLDAHSNKSNHYSPGAGTDAIAFMANEFINCRGYVVWQDAVGPIIVGFNHIPVYQDGAPWHRTLTEDTNTAGAASEGLIFNNTLPPHPTNTEGGTAIALADQQSTITYTIVNNVAHGMDDPADFHVGYEPALFAGNVNGYIAATQSAGDFDAIEATVETDKSAVWSDYANEDFSPATGSPILTTVGVNPTTKLSALNSGFTQVDSGDWAIDYKGQTVDWSELPVGADTGLTFVRPGPLLTSAGSSSVGNTTADGTITTDNASGTLYAAAYPDGSQPATIAALKAGTGAAYATSTTGFGTGTETFNASGLTGGTAYRWWFVQNDGTNDSNVAVSDPFTTTSAVNLLDTASDWELDGGSGNVTLSGGELAFNGVGTFVEAYLKTASLVSVSESTNYTITIYPSAVVDGDRFWVKIRPYVSIIGGTETTEFDTNTDGTIVVDTPIVISYSTGAGHDGLRVWIEMVSGGGQVTFNSVTVEEA